MCFSFVVRWDGRSSPPSSIPVPPQAEAPEAEGTMGRAPFSVKAVEGFPKTGGASVLDTEPGPHGAGSAVGGRGVSLPRGIQLRTQTRNEPDRLCCVSDPHLRPPLLPSLLPRALRAEVTTL